jgi:rhamnogalacturonyl hydrolase YesR
MEAKMKKTFAATIATMLIASLVWVMPAYTDQTIFRAREYKTENVIFLNTDGLRYEDGFAKGAQTMPHLWNELRPNGAICTSMWNNATTYTAPAHAACITGSWQYQPNNGRIRPNTPTIFEYFRKQFGAKPEDTLVLPGKGNSWHLNYSMFPGFGRPYETPFYALGGNDDEIVKVLKERMANQKPRLVYAILPHVDSSGHVDEYPKYLETIKHADDLIWDVWNTIQSDPFYKEKTTLVVTTDHGRHTTGIKDGYKSHGDTCEGCRKTYALFIGPDIKKGYEYKKECHQVDLAPTIGQLMGFATPAADGKPLMDVLVDRPEKKLTTEMSGYILGFERECSMLGQKKYDSNLEKMLKASMTIDSSKLGFKLREAIFMQGVLEASQKLSKKDGIAYVQKWADRFIADKPKLANISDCAIGNVFALLSQQTGDTKYLDQAKSIADWVMTFPFGKTREGAIQDNVFVTRKLSQKLVLTQTIFAIMPMFAEVSKKHGDVYTKFTKTQYDLHKKLLADSNGLFRHYFNPTAKAADQVNPVSWVRGSAYVLLGMMDSATSVVNDQRSLLALGSDKLVTETLHRQQQNGTWMDDLSGECSDIDTVSNGLLIAGYCAWFNGKSQKSDEKPQMMLTDEDLDSIAADPTATQPKNNYLGGALCAAIGAWDSWNYMISDSGFIFGSSNPAPFIQRGYDPFMPPVYSTDRGFSIEGQGAMMMALSRLSTLCENTGQTFYRKPPIR